MPELERKEFSEEISALVGADVTKDLVASSDFNEKYNRLYITIKELNAIKEEIDLKIKTLIDASFLETGEATIVTEQYRFTYITGSFKESFDTKSFKRDYPELYNKYVKVISVKSCLKVTKR